MTPSLHTSGDLREPLVRVVETAFFAVADVEPPTSVVDQPATEWFRAGVRFSGPFSGVVSVAVPVALANELTELSLGGEPMDDQSVLDLCGEFANQLAGSWLTGLDLKQRFTLDRPQVERHTSGGDGTPVMVNDQPAVLGLTLDAEADDEAGQRTGR